MRQALSQLKLRGPGFGSQAYHCITSGLQITISTILMASMTICHTFLDD